MASQAALKVKPIDQVSVFHVCASMKITEQTIIARLLTYSSGVFQYEERDTGGNGDLGKSVILFVLAK